MIGGLIRPMRKRLRDIIYSRRPVEILLLGLLLCLVLAGGLQVLEELDDFLDGADGGI